MFYDSHARVRRAESKLIQCIIYIVECSSCRIQSVVDRCEQQAELLQRAISWMCRASEAPRWVLSGELRAVLVVQTHPIVVVPPSHQSHSNSPIVLSQKTIHNDTFALLSLGPTLSRGSTTTAFVVQWVFLVLEILRLHLCHNCEFLLAPCRQHIVRQCTWTTVHITYYI